MPATHSIVRLAAVALLSLFALEAALQLAFPLLPSALIEPMPQYRQRMGFRLEAAHGAREYPAGQKVDYHIGPQGGDLFALTCLSPAAAVEFAPYRVQFTRDQHGFRNDGEWARALDIVFLGDSFTAAEAVQAPFWQGLGGAQLVLGLPGSGTLEQERLYEAFARPRQPKLLVLAYFAGNDLADSALFAQLQRRGQSFAQHVQRAKSPLDYSLLVHMGLRLRSALSPASEGDCHYPQLAQTQPPQLVAFYDEFLAQLTMDSEDLRASEAFQLTRQSISRMAAAQQAHGGQMLLLYIPQKAEVYWPLLSAEVRARIMAGASTMVMLDMASAALDENGAMQRRVWAETAQELGIAFLDMLPALQAATSAGQRVYFFADTHWNQAGHNIAQNALLDWLNDFNLGL